MPNHMEEEHMQHMQLMKAKYLEQANAQDRLQLDFNSLKAEMRQLKDQLSLQAAAESSIPTFLESTNRLESKIATPASHVHVLQRLDTASESGASSTQTPPQWAAELVRNVNDKLYVANQNIEILRTHRETMHRQVKMIPTNVNGFFFSILVYSFQILCINLRRGNWSTFSCYSIPTK